MKKYLIILIAAFTWGYAGGYMVAAQDSTAEPPTQEITTNTPEATSVVVVPPVEPVEVTAEPTPTPEQSKPFDINIVLPYLGAGLVIAILGIIGVAGAGLLLLFRSTPAVQFAAKTLVPPLGDAGVTAYEGYAKLTPLTWDDDLAKELRAEWEAFKQQITTSITPQAVLTPELKAHINAQVESQMSKYPVG